MSRFGSWLLFFLLPLPTLGIVGCGSSRQLQSVTLSPASADAQNFPNGQVSFTATGTFSKKPSPQTLTSKGLAQCLPGFTGTVTILAGTESSSMMNPDGGSQLKIFGGAELTCP